MFYLHLLIYIFCIFKASSSEIKASVTNFLKLVHTLVDDQCQRDIFYQVSWLALDVISLNSELVSESNQNVWSILILIEVGYIFRFWMTGLRVTLNICSGSSGLKVNLWGSLWLQDKSGQGKVTEMSNAP